MMKADYFTAKGDKPLAQDYANVKSNSTGVRIVLSDGCSGAPHSEVGAMLLSQIALDDVMTRLFMAPDVNFFLEALVGKAQGIANLIGLSSESVNATFAMAVEKDEILKTIFFGDGYVFWKIDEVTVVVNVSYNSGNRSIPYYLSYHFDEERRKRFSEQNINRKVSTYDFDPEGTMDVSEHDVVVSTNSNKIADPFIVGEIRKNPKISFYGFASDGFSSLYKKQGGRKEFLDPSQCAVELHRCLDFPFHSGKFVQRNMDFHLERWEKEGIKFYDDLSIVAMGT